MYASIHTYIHTCTTSIQVEVEEEEMASLFFSLMRGGRTMEESAWVLRDLGLAIPLDLVAYLELDGPKREKGLEGMYIWMDGWMEGCTHV